MSRLYFKPDPFKKGATSLSKEALDHILRTIPRQIYGDPNVSVNIYGDRVVIGLSGQNPTLPGVGNYVNQYSVVQEFSDYIKCAPFVQPVNDSYLTNVLVTNPGSGYTSAPEVQFSGGLNPSGVAAQAHAVLAGDGTIDSIAIDDPGSGYFDAPDVELVGGGGVDAEAQAIINIIYQQPQFYDPSLNSSIPGGYIYIAKPYWLQQTPWDGRSVVINGVSYEVNYSDLGQRTITDPNGVSILQTLTPDYMPGDLIQAVNCSTGYFDPEQYLPIIWMDLNEAGRNWADSRITPPANSFTGASVYQASSVFPQIIPGDSSVSVVVFGQTQFDTNNFTSGHIDRFVVPDGMSGYYRVGTTVLWDPTISNQTGHVAVLLTISGSDPPSFISPVSLASDIAYLNGSAGGAYLVQTVETIWHLNAGDYVQVKVMQDSGSNLQIFSTSFDGNSEPGIASANPRFWIQKVG